MGMTSRRKLCLLEETRFMPWILHVCSISTLSQTADHSVAGNVQYTVEQTIAWQRCTPVVLRLLVIVIFSRESCAQNHELAISLATSVSPLLVANIRACMGESNHMGFGPQHAWHPLPLHWHRCVCHAPLTACSNLHIAQTAWSLTCSWLQQAFPSDPKWTKLSGLCSSGQYISCVRSGCRCFQAHCKCKSFTFPFTLHYNCSPNRVRNPPLKCRHVHKAACTQSLCKHMGVNMLWCNSSSDLPWI